MTKFIWTRGGLTVVGDAPPPDTSSAECADSVTPNTHYFDVTTGTCQPIPAGPDDARARFDPVSGTWAGGSSLFQQMADQVATLANYRWQVETGGVIHNGTRFASDDRALSKYQGIASALALGVHTALTPVKWRSLDGWIDTTYGAMTQVGAAVLAHQSDCFKAQASVEASIPATDPMSIDVTAAFDAALAALNS